MLLVACLGCLEWPSRRDHHLITSSDQLADSDGRLINPPVDFVPSWLQHQAGKASSKGVMKLAIC